MKVDRNLTARDLKTKSKLTMARMKICFFKEVVETHVSAAEVFCLTTQRIPSVNQLCPPLLPSSLRWGIVSSWWAAVACGRKWSLRPPATHSPCRSRWALRKALLSPSTTWPPTWCCLRWPIWGRARAFSSTWQQVRHTQRILIQWVFLYCIFSPIFVQIPSIQTVSLKKKKHDMMVIVIYFWYSSQ